MNLAAAALFGVIVVANDNPLLVRPAFSATTRTSSRTPQLQRFSGRGIVKQIALDRASASIAHDDIVGYMNAMTMGFKAKNVLQLNGIAVGDRVEFTITVVDDGPPMLERIVKR